MEERVFTLSMREARGGAEIEHQHGCDGGGPYEVTRPCRQDRPGLLLELLGPVVL